MTFLVIGSPDDYCCEQVSRILKEEGQNVLFIHENSLTNIVCSWKFPSSGYVRYGQQNADIQDILGVLNRLRKWRFGSDEDEQYAMYEWKGAMLALLHSLQAPVINKPRPEFWYRESRSTFDHVLTLFEFGLKPPKSIVTDALSDAHTFLSKHDGRVFLHPLSSFEYIYEIGDRMADRALDKLAGKLPLRLVEYAEGERLEAYAIGGKIIAADSHGKLADLGSKFERTLRSLQSILDIIFFQVHLVEAQGEYYCLGLDDMPVYGWCEQELREIIDHQLVEILGIKV